MVNAKFIQEGEMLTVHSSGDYVLNPRATSQAACSEMFTLESIICASGIWVGT